ncbi:hypothetical protein [Microbacterium sp. SA39]|nr:hypothetical protein [Microbacterium sp. SA39]KJQ55602.1 hypothetical protein RS85_00465 [Microbacterium sp. SA39]
MFGNGLDIVALLAWVAVAAAAAIAAVVLIKAIIRLWRRASGRNRSDADR